MMVNKATQLSALKEKENLLMMLLRLRNEQKELFDMTDKELETYNDEVLDELNAIREEIEELLNN
jgi:NTP pyrophosphatase (non-canonical NTP hydrolase)